MSAKPTSTVDDGIGREKRGDREQRRVQRQIREHDRCVRRRERPDAEERGRERGVRLRELVSNEEHRADDDRQRECGRHCIRCFAAEAREEPRRGAQQHAEEHDADDVESRLRPRALLGIVDRASRNASATTGTLTRNTRRQSMAVSSPPTSGPSVAPAPDIAPVRPKCIPARSPAARRRIPRPFGTMSARRVPAASERTRGARDRPRARRRSTRPRSTEARRA